MKKFLLPLILLILSSCIRVNVHKDHKYTYQSITVLQVNEDTLYFSFLQRDQFNTSDHINAMMALSNDLCFDGINRDNIYGPWDKGAEYVYLVSCKVKQEYVLNYIKFIYPQ